MMRPVKLLILAGVAAGVAAGAGTPIAASNAVRSVVDALDRCVQHRFVRIDKGFGMSRVSTAMHNISQFIPVNDSERQVVRELETMSVRLVMYLASWQKPRVGPFGGAAIPPLIQGPILVNPAPQVMRTTPAGAPVEVYANPLLLEDLPDEGDVSAEASRSLTALTDSGSREFEVGRWRFIARPVRASAESCLVCHNRRPSAVAASEGRTVDNVFRLGDPIGAVLYGFQMSSARR